MQEPPKLAPEQLRHQIGHSRTCSVMTTMCAGTRWLQQLHRFPRTPALTLHPNDLKRLTKGKSSLSSAESTQRLDRFDGS